MLQIRFIGQPIQVTEGPEAPYILLPVHFTDGSKQDFLVPLTEFQKITAFFLSLTQWLHETDQAADDALAEPVDLLTVHGFALARESSSPHSDILLQVRLAGLTAGFRFESKMWADLLATATHPKLREHGSPGPALN